MKGRFAIALLLLLPLVMGAAPKHAKKNKKDLLRQHAELKKKRAALAAQAHKIRAAAHHVRSDIYSIDSKIVEHVQELRDIQTRLAVNQKRAVVLAKKLEQATIAFQKKSEQARERVREMYMHGDATLAAAFVGTTDMGDFASREFVCGRIAERDRQLVEQVKEARLVFVRTKQENDAVVAQNKKDIEDEKTAKAELEDERQDKTDALQDLKVQEGNIEQLIHQLDEEDNQVMSDIQAFEAGPGIRGLSFHGRFQPPCYGARLASGFGMRFHPILHRYRMHTGQDFACPYGTGIHCAADGVVVSTRYMHGYGNAIIVEHGNGYSTLYGHCSSIIARPGQHVSKNEVIARVGATGLATGPHCHFEIRVNGRPVNPMQFLRG